MNRAEKLFETMKVRLTFVEDVLGTASSDPEIHENFIASKAPDAMSLKEEVEAIGVDAAVAKGKTVFHRDKDGNPILFDYQIKGFFKNAAKAYQAVDKKTLPAYKTKIDNLVFVKERQIPFKMNGEIGNCQRPLRAQTAQGERVALANSESVPAGSSIEFTVQTMVPGLMDRVKEWLDYGAYNGIGQWHNSGAGRFVWEEI